MNKNRFRKPVAATAGCFFLFVAPGLTLSQSAPPGSARTPTVASPVAQQKKDTPPPDDFAGLQYTDEQKAEIDKIHQETKSHKDVAAKDQKLTADQKDAMLLGYTRMESGRIYKVLTPEQQKEVNQRIRARRAADQATQQKQPPAK